MKTAEETYNELIPRGLIVLPTTKAVIIATMKAFASQAIDKCAEEAETVDIHEGKNNYMSHMVVDRASILKVKELLK